MPVAQEGRHCPCACVPRETRGLDGIPEEPLQRRAERPYIAGDNAASAEGEPDGTVNEVKGLNGVSRTIEEALAHYDEIGGPKPSRTIRSAGRGQATHPFQWVKQVASHLGGSRNPMVVWPKVIKHDDKPRAPSRRCHADHYGLVL